MRTFIKYSGNKSRCLQHILPHIPKEYNTYFEPFCGSGAILLKLEPQQWVVNDLNTDLISVWQCIRDSPEYIVEYFQKFAEIFDIPNKERILLCKELTQKLNGLEEGSERSTLFLLMKYCAFMGHIMVKGRFNFQSGLDGAIFRNQPMYFLSEKYFSHIRKISNFLNSVGGSILNKDYKEILLEAKDGDFVFLDPPYVELNDYKFNYNFGEKNDLDFVLELVRQVDILDGRNVKWMMTQGDTPEIRNHFGHYFVSTYPVYRHAGKSYKTELLIKNY